MMMASAQNKELFIDDQTVHKAKYNPQPTKKVNLPRWQVGEHIIHARNLKEATKYAKKKGLYQPGIKITPLD